MNCQSAQCAHQLYHDLDADIQVVDDQLTINFERIVTGGGGDDDDDKGNGVINECAYLYSFQRMQKTLLLAHPVCQAFVYLKWQNKIRYPMMVRITLTVVTILLLSLYIVVEVSRNIYRDASAADGGDADGQNASNNTFFLYVFCDRHPNVVNATWHFIVAMTTLNKIRIALSMVDYKSIWAFLTLPNVLQMVVMTCVLVLNETEDPNKRPRWQISIGAICIMCGWTLVYLLMGYMTSSGLYVTMFRSIIRYYFHMLYAFAWILIGFAFTFCVLERTVFQDPVVGVIRAVSMMAGGIDIDSILQRNYYDSEAIAGVAAQSGWPLLQHTITILLFCVFVVVITVALTNMLVTLMISDMDMLEQSAQSERDKQRLAAAYFMEKTLQRVSAVLPGAATKFTNRLVRLWASNSGAAHNRTVTVHLWPHLSRRGRQILPDEVIYAAYKVVQERADGDQPSATDKLEKMMHVLQVELDYMTIFLEKLSSANENNLASEIPASKDDEDEDGKSDSTTSRG